MMVPSYQIRAVGHVESPLVGRHGTEVKPVLAGG